MAFKEGKAKQPTTPVCSLFCVKNDHVSNFSDGTMSG